MRPIRMTRRVRLARAMRAELISSEFGNLLRHWRRTRGVSQLELANRAGLSTRHLSFLETGRCGPSRSSVLQLGRALDLPRAETDRLLLLAGHAGDWSRLSADAARVREQLGRLAPLLAAHDPLPALVSDPDWCVAWHNRGARALFRLILERAPHLASEPVDLRRILADADSLGSLIVNRDELLSEVVMGLYQLEPDPASFGNARSLLAVLPASDGAGDAVERASCASAWQHELRLRAGDRTLALEIFSLPFARPASGFALVLLRPAREQDRPQIEAHFEALIQRAS
jgi:transcriptional regulator with XRE-family HTH domain